MYPLQFDLSDPQAAALFHLVIQIPAQSLREWAVDESEAESMRQALDSIRAALTAHGFKSP